MSSPYPPRPVLRPDHRTSCPAPERHRHARVIAAVVTALVVALAATYTAHFRSADGDPADRGVTWMLAAPTWIIGAVTIASLAALLLPARLHHRPARWIALSLTIGIGVILAGLVAEFGGYMVLDLLGVSS